MTTRNSSCDNTENGLNRKEDFNYNLEFPPLKNIIASIIEI
jgi:hypothetical protein